MQNTKINLARTNLKEGDKWWGHFSITDESNNSLVSVGPTGQPGKNNFYGKLVRDTGATEWSNYAEESGTWKVRLNNVSSKVMNNYMNNISKWDLLLNSCAGHGSRALWMAGVPNIYGFHPHLLNLQLMITQMGIYSNPYLYQIPRR